MRASSKFRFVTFAIALASLVTPTTASASGSDPRPIPIGFGIWHENGPVYSTSSDPTSGLVDSSTITDFAGWVAATEIQGTGTGTQNGQPFTFAYDVDMRFMRGKYIGMDKRLHYGTFGFV